MKLYRCDQSVSINTFDEILDKVINIFDIFDIFVIKLRYQVCVISWFRVGVKRLHNVKKAWRAANLQQYRFPTY